MKIILGKVIGNEIKPLAEIKLNQTGKKLLIDKNLPSYKGQKKHYYADNCKFIKIGIV